MQTRPAKAASGDVTGEKAADEFCGRGCRIVPLCLLPTQHSIVLKHLSSSVKTISFTRTCPEDPFREDVTIPLRMDKTRFYSIRIVGKSTTGDRKARWSVRYEVCRQTTSHAVPIRASLHEDQSGLLPTRLCTAFISAAFRKLSPGSHSLLIIGTSSDSEERAAWCALNDIYNRCNTLIS